jgi:hypothetical protein
MKNERFLKQRLRQLDPYIKELVPYMPEFSNLEVVGKGSGSGKLGDEQRPTSKQEAWKNPDLVTGNQSHTDNPYDSINNADRHDALADYPDVMPEIVFGPSLLFGGQVARWTGSDMENNGIIALENRLNFETKAGKRVLATFEIVNCGTTVIYFDWRVCCLVI